MTLVSHFTLPSGQPIGKGQPTYVIAEIGSNHDASLDKAQWLIERAALAGADAVKFQSFQTHTLINGQHRVQQSWQAHPAWDTLQKLALPESWHAALVQCAKDNGVDFTSTPFDLERLTLLEALNVPFIKIASGDLTYHTLLRAAAQTGKPIILATGAAHFAEVDEAVQCLEQAGCTQLVLLHCVSLYPPQFADANIRVVETLQKAYPCPVGYSDHTAGWTVPLAAVALGACVIEKHVTDDRANAGPDHPFAMNFEELAEMVQQLRHLEVALGDGYKNVPPNEQAERIPARRALYAKMPITQGERLTAENVKVVRPAYPDGISAEHYDCVLGHQVQVEIPEHGLITWGALTP